MTESYMCRLITEATRARTSEETLGIQDKVISLYRRKDKKGIIAMLQSEQVWNEQIKDFLTFITFENYSGVENTSKESNEPNEALFEALLPQFDTDAGTVKRKLVVLPASDLSYETCENTARKVFAEYDMRGKMVLPLIMPERKDTFVGVVGTGVSATPKEIRLVEVFEVKSKEGIGHKIRYIGETIDGRGGKFGKTNYYFSLPFWLYKFENESDKQVYILLSKDKIEPGYFRIKGCPIVLRDASSIGDSISLPNDLMLLYPTHIEPDINPIDEAEFKKITKGLGHEELASMLTGELRHPLWFEKLLIAWAFSGEYDRYPLHFAWVSPPGCGKTHVLDSLNYVYRELPGVFNGANSTFKDLVPSFGTTIPKEGYLAKVRRVGLVDEFFTCVMKASVSGLKVSDPTGELTCLLDHTVGQVGSGRHEPVDIRCRGKILFATNPKQNLSNMTELSTELNGAFCSRVLWYFTTKQHAEFIKENKPRISSMRDKFPKHSSIVQITDYLSGISLPVDWRKTKEISDRCLPLIPSATLPIYDARSVHNINCLVDGIAKYNCIVEGREKLEITEKDYVDAEALFSDVISTWSTADSIRSIPIKLRKNHVSLSARRLFDTVEVAGSIKETELASIHDQMKDYDKYLSELASVELIKKIDGKIYPHWHRELKG